VHAFCIHPHLCIVSCWSQNYLLLSSLPFPTLHLSFSIRRPWPGNPLESQGEQQVICNRGNTTLVIRIADSCPCTQVRWLVGR
jgi:hypothetical protein